MKAFTSVALAVAMAASTLTLAPRAEAALKVYEPFDYAAATNVGTITDASSSSDVGFAGGYSTSNAGTDSLISAGSLAYPSLTTAGNKYRTRAGTSNWRSFGETYAATSGSVLFGSLLMQMEAGANGTTNPFVIFGNGNGGTDATTVSAKGYRIVRTATDGTVQFQVRNNNSTANSINVSNSLVSTATDPSPVLLLAFKITVGTVAGTDGRVDLWVNPATADAAATHSITGIATSAMNAVDMYRLSGNSGLFMDEIRLGESLADVLPGLPIPEPTSLAMVGLAGAGLLRRRPRA